MYPIELECSYSLSALLFSLLAIWCFFAIFALCFSISSLVNLHYTFFGIFLRYAWLTFLIFGYPFFSFFAYATPVGFCVGVGYASLLALLLNPPFF